MEFIILISRPRKFWNLSKGHGKFLFILLVSDRFTVFK